MENVGVVYYGECNYYLLINCLRLCGWGELIQNYLKIFSFWLIWDKNLGSSTSWTVAKHFRIRRCIECPSTFLRNSADHFTIFNLSPIQHQRWSTFCQKLANGRNLLTCYRELHLKGDKATISDSKTYR